jgi:deazaflavin-dependent oxidoreductase (nitroreductase family)
MTGGSTQPKRAPRLPPRWFIRSAWVAHRAIHRFTGGRRGLATPTPGGKFGYLRLKTVGRRSGHERAAILGYYEDGPNLVTLAMNGWADAEPAWWLNLQAHPDAIVELKNGSRKVRARAAEGEERARLWANVRDYSGYGNDVRRICLFAVIRNSGGCPGGKALRLGGSITRKRAPTRRLEHYYESLFAGWTPGTKTINATVSRVKTASARAFTCRGSRSKSTLTCRAWP